MGGSFEVVHLGHRLDLPPFLGGAMSALFTGQMWSQTCAKEGPNLADVPVLYVIHLYRMHFELFNSRAREQ